jgi:Zn-finger nucleic acid-binding protein
MLCPCCRRVLRSTRVDEQPLEECDECSGQFVSHPALQHILLAHAPPTKLRGAGYSRPSPLSEPVRYRECPVCSEVMLRKNFAGASGVVVDVCPVHGLWLDRGELATMIEFAATGAWRQAERDTAERTEARKSLDAWMQELRLGAPQHGASTGGLGEISRVIPEVAPKGSRGRH